MSSINLREVRSIDLSKVFESLPEPKRELLCTYLDGDDCVEVRSNTFTLVLNRDIRKSVEIASGMALWTARKYPERHVLLVNTYAGADLLQRSLAVGMWKMGIILPPSLRRYIPFGGENSDFDDGVAPAYPNNLQLLDCPTSTFSIFRLEAELQERESDIVILDSFEFSALSLEGRRQLANGLLELRERRSLTVVIFSHEMKTDLAAFTPGRGAMGILSAHAGSVWRILTLPERKKWEKQAGSPIIHETKTHSSILSTYAERKKEPVAEKKFFF